MNLLFGMIGVLIVLLNSLNARRVSGDMTEPPSNNTIGMAGIANLRSPGGLERGTHSFLAVSFVLH